MFDSNLVVFAQGAPQSGLGSMLLPMGIMFVIFYFLVWRPQSEERKEHENFVKGLKSGDEVVTAGGLLGTVSAVDGLVVTIEISKGTKVKVLKSQVQGSKAKLVQGAKAESDE